MVGMGRRRRDEGRGSGVEGDRLINIVTEAELAWCAANPGVPQAAAVLEALGADGSRAEDPAAPELAPLALALRAVRPRDPLRIGDVYAFLMVVGGAETLMFRPTPRGVDAQIGLDRQHARLIRRDLPDEDRDGWRVARFALERVVPDEEMVTMASANGPDGTLREFFAAVGRPGGDEALVGLATRWGVAPLCFQEAERMAAAVPIVQATREHRDGAPAEIRRWTRSWPVDRDSLTILVG